MAKGPTGRRRRGRRVGVPRVEGSCLHLGERDIPLYSGAVHYWRLDPSRWRPALTQLRALGLPMVETYVPWQVHERAPGIYDFGDHEPAKDLGAFLDLAASLDLAVFLRPGPHINAEMTFFGLPERVVYDRACQARSPKQNAVLQGFPPRFFPVPSYASDTFHDECARYFRALGEVVAPRLWPAGPVALLQIDNEGAYYFRDGAYDQDYHPDAALRWRAFLRERYGSLEAAREVHRASYRSWEEVEPPVRFAATEPGELVVHLDWAAFREVLVTEALSRFGQSMKAAGLDGVPTVHNLPLGDQGMSVSPPQIETVVDIVGFDYYHGRREHRTIKRRTLYLAGTHDLAYAPELGIGAPPWFSPLSSEDSLFTVQSALAYGLRGFNLYMLVDRDRWYGAPIDTEGNPRVDAGTWKHLLAVLQQSGFHRLKRRVEVGLMMPREYARLSRVTSLLGFLSPLILDALGGNPVEASREDDLGFRGPIQVLWWTFVARFADALTAAGVPYVYVDGDADPSRLDGLRVLITPSFEFCAPERWRALTAFAEGGGTVVYGPTMPALDLAMRRRLFEVPQRSRRVAIDTDRDAHRAVDDLVRDLGLQRPFPVGPAPLETAVHEDDQGPRLLFLINPAKEPRTATVELPAPMSLEDTLSGERFAGRAHVTIPIRGWSCRIFGILEAADAGSGQAERVAS